MPELVADLVNKVMKTKYFFNESSVKNNRIVRC